MVKVTFILPSLNVAEYIEECVESALNQSLAETEILCIDAGSTDGTEEIIRCYAEDERYHNRVRFLHSDVKSYGYQVNLGIRDAKGEYVAILETDDYIKPDMAEKMYAVAEDTQADMVRADYEAFYILPSGRKRFSRFRMFQDEVQYGSVVRTGDDAFYYLNDQNIWRGLYRKQFLTDHNILLNESAGAAYQDLGFVMQALACAECVVYMDEAFYQYRLNRPGSSSYSPKCVKFIYQEYLRLLKDSSINAKFPTFSGIYLRMIQSFVGEYEKALISNDYDLDSENLKTYYDYFQSEINSHLDMLPEARKQLGDKCVDALELLLRDSEAYSNWIRTREAEKKNTISSVVEALKDKKIIIFGAGARGRGFLDFLESHDLTAEAFADNNSDMWGKEFEGHKVIEPETCFAQTKEKNTVVCIANKTHETEIYEQMIMAGVPEKAIVRTSAFYEMLV